MKIFKRFFVRLITLVLAFLVVVYVIHIYYQKQSHIFRIIDNNGRPVFANRIKLN